MERHTCVYVSMSSVEKKGGRAKKACGIWNKPSHLCVCIVLSYI